MLEIVRPRFCPHLCEQQIEDKIEGNSRFDVNFLGKKLVSREMRKYSGKFQN